MPEPTVRLIAVGLVGAFVWAAAAKLIDRAGWHDAVASHRLPRPLEVIARWGVPAAELLVVGLILLTPLRTGGAVAAAALGVFTLVLVRAWVVVGPRLSCGCFGRDKSRDVRMMIGRNLLLVTGAVTVSVEGRGIGLIDGLSAPAASEVVPALLVVVGLAAAGWLAWAAASMSRGGR